MRPWETSDPWSRTTREASSLRTGSISKSIMSMLRVNSHGRGDVKEVDPENFGASASWGWMTRVT